MTTTTAFATPADVALHGEYRIVRNPGDDRPLYRFQNRVTADGSSGLRAEPGRYHLYAGWFCPWAQRAVIERALNGLDDVVGLSYVDNSRDARGWAFRETYGPDPVNGFTLLRDAYDATEPGFDGHVSVPTLWDRVTGQVVSNDFVGIGIDLATQFTDWSNGAELYPEAKRAAIEDLDSWIGPAVNRGAHVAAGDGPEAAAARAALLDAYDRLDGILATSRYLLGDSVTEADVRLYVTLARYDVQSRASGGALPELASYTRLWRYARDLYRIPEFGSTTDFTTYGPTGADHSNWDDATGLAST